MAAKEGVKECTNHQPVVLNEVYLVETGVPKGHKRRMLRPNRLQRFNALPRTERRTLRMRKRAEIQKYLTAKDVHPIALDGDGAVIA